MNSLSKHRFDCVRLGFKHKSDPQAHYQKVIASYEQNFSACKQRNTVPLPFHDGMRSDLTKENPRPKDITPASVLNLAPSQTMEPSTYPVFPVMKDTEDASLKPSALSRPEHSHRVDFIRDPAMLPLHKEEQIMQKNRTSIQGTTHSHETRTGGSQNTSKSEIPPAVPRQYNAGFQMERKIIHHPSTPSPADKANHDPRLSQLLVETKQYLEEMLKSRTDQYSFEPQQNEVRSIKQRRIFFADQD